MLLLLPRAQAAKVYVQDRLRESGALMWRLLQAGGHFYVCGDAAHMAGAVEDALLDIIEAHQVRPLVHIGSACYRLSVMVLHGLVLLWYDSASRGVGM